MGDMNRLKTKLCNLTLKNPLMPAAGCAGHSNELSRIEEFEYENLGAFVTKGVTLSAREGNSSPRVVEVRGGMLNSIGLQNNGLKFFMEEELPALKEYNIPIIVNVAANDLVDFENLFISLKEYSSAEFIRGIEINVSCPNVKCGGLVLGSDPLEVECILNAAREVFNDKILITKLSPNVTDITDIAEAAIKGGTDALSMINTVRGCAVDIDSKKFILGEKFGGMSGPAIKSIGLYAVQQCRAWVEKCKSGEIPIIGVGGIVNYRDVLEYIMVGASAVQIGTGFFYDIDIFCNIIRDLESYCEEYKTTISELIGIVV